MLRRMDDLQKVTDQMEYLFLKQIVRSLRDESLTLEQAKQCAREFLPIEPFQSLDDAKEKINRYVSTYPQFKSVQDYVNAYHEDKQADQKVAEMKHLITENKIDEAIQVAKE